MSSSAQKCSKHVVGLGTGSELTQKDSRLKIRMQNTAQMQKRAQRAPEGVDSELMMWQFLLGRELVVVELFLAQNNW